MREHVTLPETEIDDAEYALKLGRDLMIVRSALGLTQKKMADRFNVCERQYARWELKGLLKIEMLFWMHLHAVIEECKSSGLFSKYQVLSAETIALTKIMHCRISIAITKIS